MKEEEVEEASMLMLLKDQEDIAITRTTMDKIMNLIVDRAEGLICITDENKRCVLIVNLDDIVAIY